MLLALLFFVFPAVIYAALVTKGSFDLLMQDYGWQTYNRYALALAHLRQSIPAEAISGEGLYLDGQVFLYYGQLPALMRFPLMPFVDLTRVSVAPLMVWTMLIIGQGAMQVTVLRLVAMRNAVPSALDLLLLAIVSYCLWFGSGGFLLIQDNNFYHEPSAAGWMLGGIFLAMLANDLLIAPRRPGAGRLLAYAGVAGLSVFSKQTFAVGMYVATLGMMLPDWRTLRAGPLRALAAAAPRAILPLLVMLAAGLASIAISYARLGRFGTGWDVAHYGYYLIGKRAWRLETMIEQQFSLVRIGPTIMHLLVGGNSLRGQAIEWLGGGRTLALGPSVRGLIYAPMALAIAGSGAVLLYRRIRTSEFGLQLAVASAGIALIALLQLSYATMQYRYAAETWLLLVWLMLVATRDLPATLFAGRIKAVAVVAAGLALLSIGYMATLRPKLANDHPRGPGSLWSPLPDELAARATAPGARDPSISMEMPKDRKQRL